MCLLLAVVVSCGGGVCVWEGVVGQGYFLPGCSIVEIRSDN